MAAAQNMFQLSVLGAMIEWAHSSRCEATATAMSCAIGSTAEKHPVSTPQEECNTVYINPAGYNEPAAQLPHNGGTLPPTDTTASWDAANHTAASGTN
jgi:hypothetical protein